MAPPRLLPDDDTLRRLHEKRIDGRRITHVEIAEMYGVKPNAVYNRFRAMGLTHDRNRYKDLLPWTVATKHRHSYPAECLRLEGRRRRNVAEGRDPFDGFAQGKAGMLENFLAGLGPRGAGGLVVNYDPDCPPNPLSATGGFWLQNWEKRDGDSLVRVPEMQRNARTGRRTQKRS